jgi:hypothetical protein
VVLKVVDPGVRGWAVVVVMSLIPWVVGQLHKSFPFGRAKDTSTLRKA